MVKQIRSKKVVCRAQDVLTFLEANGPSTLAAIASGTGLSLHHARYAAVILNTDGKAHVSGFRRMLRHGDRIPRNVAIFSEGPGTSAKLRSVLDDMELDWKTTQHLQPIYQEWTRTRTPDYYDEDEQL